MTSWKSWVALVFLLASAAGGYGFWHQQRTRHLQSVRSDAIQAARLALEKGDTATAIEGLAAATGEIGRPDRTILYLTASALERDGRSDEAFRHWEQLDREFPDHPYGAEVLAARAARADLAKDFVTARDLYGRILEQHPTSAGAERARVGLFELEHRLGNAEEARTLGLALVDDASLPMELRMRVADVLGAMNMRQLYSREAGPGDEVYTVQSGDVVQKIAARHNISQDLLLKINGIADPRQLSVGRRLKIPRVSFSIEVDKFTNTLTVRSNGEFFKRYRCRTGRFDYMTPTGEYKIINKKVDPDWRKPGTGEFIPAGDPRNELGTRWMAFDGSSLGIHGTIDPATIGRYTSQGCVGMLKEDVEELFEYIPLGTPLKIFGEQNPALRQADPEQS